MAKRVLFWLACACAAARLAAMPAGYSLPVGYEDVQWIEGTTGGKQWILTDLTPECTDTVEMRVRFRTHSTQTLFCSRTDMNSNSFVGFLFQSKVRMDRSTAYQTISSTADLTTTYDLVFDFKNRTVSQNGTVETLSNLPDADYTPGSKISLFASHQAGIWLTAKSSMNNFGLYRLFNFAVKSQTGEYKMALVPAKETETGRIGLYDVVGQKFYPNISETPFLSAADMSEPVWTEEGNDKLAVTVPGTYALDEEDISRIASSGRKLVVRGPGTLSVESALEGFTNELIIESGTLVARAVNALGRNTEKQYVRILDGAALAIDVPVTGMITNKIFEFEGEGPDGKGALQLLADRWDCISGCEFHLTGDAKINLRYRIDLRNKLDTHGHNLTVDSTPWVLFPCGGVAITNSASTASLIVNNGGTTTTEWNSDIFRGEPGNIYRLINGARWTLKNPVKSRGWKFEFCDGTYVNVDSTCWTDDGWKNPGTTRFEGHVDFAGDTRVTALTNTVVTFAGPFSGSGTMKVDGGWLNIDTEEMSYSGSMSVVANQNRRYPWRAGLGVRRNTPVTASGLSFTDADFRLPVMYTNRLPRLEFAGGENTISGGHIPAATRVECAGIVISNNSEVVLDTSLFVTGAVEVSGGSVLRIPAQFTATNNPGLKCYIEYPEPSDFWFVQIKKPAAEDFERNDTIYCPYGLETVSGALSKDFAAIYHFRGYVWNRTGENANWSFHANFSDRTHIWLDGEKIISNAFGYDGTPMKDQVATVNNIAPGPHEICIVLTKNKGSTGSQWVKAFNGRYALGFDKLGRGSTNKTDSAQFCYEPLLDPGDGTLLTVDLNDPLDEPAFISTFTNLTMSADSTLDAGGHPLSVGTFKGAPTVANLPELTVSESLVLPAADLISGPLVLDGNLVFAEGATIDVDAEGIREISREDRKRLSKGVVAVQANEIIGNPAVAPSARTSLFSARKVGNTIKLWYNARHLIIIR